MDSIELVGKPEYVEERASEHPYFLVEFKEVNNDDEEDSYVNLTLSTADVFNTAEEADFLYALKQLVRSL